MRGKDAFREQLGPLAIREIHIEKYQVKFLGRDGFSGGGKITGASHFRPEFFQLAGDLPAQQRFIFDDENLQPGQSAILHPFFKPRNNECDETK
jgi:hypothetical protein